MKKSGFTLLEVMISIAIFSIIIIAMLRGSIVIGKQYGTIQNFIQARQELSVFIQTIHAFTNKSSYVNFWDAAMPSPVNCELDYFDASMYPYSGHTEFDELFVHKPASALAPGDPAEGRLFYDASNHRILWYRDSGPGASFEIILKDVYRPDAAFNNDGTVASNGSEPIMKFPHLANFYMQGYTGIRPLFVVFNFKKLVSRNGPGGEPLTVPVTFFAKVGGVT